MTMKKKPTIYDDPRPQAPEPDPHVLRDGTLRAGTVVTFPNGSFAQQRAHVVRRITGTTLKSEVYECHVDSGPDTGLGVVATRQRLVILPE